MSGTYFHPIKRIFLNLSGGTVTGDTVFTEGVYADSLSGGTIYSGSTDLDTIIRNISGVLTNGDFLPISGGTGGPYLFTGGTTADTLTITTTIEPSVDNIVDIGTPLIRFKSLNVVDGVAVNLTASTRIKTAQLNINDNFIISGDTGFISTYGGVSGSSLVGKFLSGVTEGFVLGNISDISSITDITRIQPGTNTTTGGTDNNPIINVIDSPIFAGIVSATGFTDSSLTSGRVIYAGALGRFTSEALFEYDAVENLLKAQKIQIGNPGDTGTTTTIYGDVLVIGESISGYTSELYIEDNLIELNYNPTASTISTSLGAGLSIQDGSGVSGTDVFWDIRGTGTTVDNRSFTTNLSNIILSESGTTSSPSGVYVIKSGDILDGGFF